ncbi:hypothetical protein NA56DRAFT_640451 [Hyaloscypha hepaticicola]|uniref:Uncharacterized protein n=1 Tax=Hyaloscypha hepaticicola TaxID=2082293 RepID=A0A2J6QN42_9HELO|nr:hypothetical protein NA56DRAFT_640451 [Hyaloscypha hepaticicola]
MSSASDDMGSLLDLSIADTEKSSCYSEDSQPRICFDEYCNFPIGDDICKACRLDRAIRKKRVSKSAKAQQAKEWVEEVNVQKYITNYTGEVFVGGATDRDAFVEEEKQVDIVEIEEDQGEANEYDGSDELNEEGRPELSDLVPKSFTSVWDISPDRSSPAEETPSPTEVSSKRYVRSDLGAFLEPRLSDLLDRTLEGQMEETTFVGGPEDDPFEELCSLCRSPVGDLIHQHVVRCQYAHDEQERMAALWTR